jgi:PAS domain S-box-containing protein
MLQIQGVIFMSKKPTYEELEKQVKALKETQKALKKTAEALKDSEEKYRKTFESITDSITVTRITDGLYLYVNDGFCHQTGYSRKEVLGRTPSHINLYAYPSERDRFIEILKSQGKAENVVVSFRRKNGEIYYSEFSAKPISYAGEECLLAQSRDITDRKRAEAALQESEEKYRNLVEESFDGIFIQKGLIITFANKRLNEMLGYEEGELIGREHHVVYHPEYKRITKERAQARMRGKEVISRYEVKLQRKDGTFFYGEINARSIRLPSDQQIGIQVWVKDIDERKRAETKLKDREAFLQTLIDAIPTPVFYKEKDGKYLGFNKAFETFFGETKKHLIGKSVFDINPTELAEIYRTKDEELFKSGGVQCYESQWKNVHGELRDFIFNKAVYADSTGAVAGLIGVMMDITERKQVEKALKESEARLKRAQSVAKVGSWEYDIPTGKVWGSHQAFRIYDIERDTPYLPLDRVEACISDAPKVHQALIDLIEKGKKYDIEFEARQEVSGQRIMIHSMAEIMDEDGKPVKVLGVIQDVTEQKKVEKERKDLEHQLQRAKKMEALGLLAGGVAHDLNNILSGIVSYPELILMDLPEDSPLRKPIKTIQESGIRATDVVADLLTLARGVATGKEISNFKVLIGEYLNSAEHKKLLTLHPGVEFKTEIDSDLLNITCSPTHMKKSLMNLVVNASEAIEGSGKVTISAINRYFDQPLRENEAVRAGEYVMLAISDNGSGIPSDDLDRIFEPFYTKKEMGRSGTGLGLSVVWNTVQDHNGHINVKSSEKGTKFELYFPVIREEMVHEKAQNPLVSYLGHREKILVVDDEKRQREIACGMLNRLGYVAEAVSSGEEAIQYVKEHSPDLIVLDMIMPNGINGLETYQAVIEIRQDQKAIIASGYSRTKKVLNAQRLGAGKYIKKPYTLEKIGLAVREELEK